MVSEKIGSASSPRSAKVRDFTRIILGMKNRKPVFSRVIKTTFRLGGNIRNRVLAVLLPSKPFLVREAKEINKARVAHLDSLDFLIDGKTILEVGAGIGEFSDRLSERCKLLVSTEGRPRLARLLKRRMRDKDNVQVLLTDVESEQDFEELTTKYYDPNEQRGKKFDTLFCYGLLYHISDPEKFLESYSKLCDSLILETVVSFASDDYQVIRESKMTNQAIHLGCRPNPGWLLEVLRRFYSSVYYCRIVPNHVDFLWNDALVPPSATPRMIFVASNEPFIPTVRETLGLHISFPLLPYSLRIEN
jgi:2-polyprenyl-3-methyl-5-hydroxy-6-metoxy-1,4-benzoquinol methylase